ncbi:MAG TPA: transposase [Fimbriimonas sp.]
MAWWPHTPLHRFGTSGAYFVTGATYQKAHLFGGRERLLFLNELLFEVALKHELRLQAWAVFSNHYHFVALVEEAWRIPQALKEFHSRASIYANQLDAIAGRKVMHQYRDTQLTYQRSYLARLRYVHQNPVHHKVVPVATDYPYCSAHWFENTAPKPFIDTLAQFKIDRVHVQDDFEVEY